jgi:ribosome biogenesis GTPase
VDKHDYAEHFDRHEQRESRSERKRLRAKDRSQYKKTDQDQRKKLAETPQEAPDAIGRVVAIVSQDVSVAIEGRVLTCTLRGTLKQERQRRKNLLTIGDMVHVQYCGTDQGVITYVEPRQTQLARADNLSRQKEHLIAANIDQVLITVSVVTPAFKPAIIDRYLIAARQGRMDAIVLINKIDMLVEDSEDPHVAVQQELYTEAKEAYALAGITLHAVSTITGEGLEELRQLMAGKTSVFSGQSGVGKSSLINTLVGTNLTTRHAVAKTRKGAHTTTTAQLLPLPEGGWVIDTPGIRSFGLWQLEQADLALHFAEIQQYAGGCFFANCTHTHESQCAVIEAVEEEKIHPLRYASYCSLLAQLQEEHLRR